MQRRTFVYVVTYVFDAQYLTFYCIFTKFIPLFVLFFQGEIGANVLVGIQVRDSEMDEFRDRANDLGYEYEVETRNEAFQLLMR